MGHVGEEEGRDGRAAGPYLTRCHVHPCAIAAGRRA